MTYNEAVRNFNEAQPRETFVNKSTGKVDVVARREAWGIYIDSLCKSGEITLKQYETWDNPF